MPDLIAKDIPDSVFRRLRELKKQHGYGDTDWVQWFAYLTRGVYMDNNLEDNIQQNTCRILGPLWMRNFAKNLPRIWAGGNLGDLAIHNAETALIIGAGPSVEANHQLEALASSNYQKNKKHLIFATDRMLIPCLKKGVVPDFVVTVDGNGEKIPLWFDNPIVAEHPEVKCLAAVTIHPNTVEKIEKAGMRIYWFHGMLDTLSQIDSLTYWLNEMAEKTIINCGGNCGTTAVVIAYSFHCNPIAFIGLNFGYLENTKYEDTACYEEIKKASPDNFGFLAAYTKIKHPFFSTIALTDMVFMRYRDSFIKMMSWLKFKEVKLINCTEGGILFCPGMDYMYFKDFLRETGD
jgi:hypothetical protein